MAIIHHPDIIQGSDEWHALRCGVITASSMSLILTPTLKVASNDKERAYLFELLAQRVTSYVEPSFVSDDMMRGQCDEVDARRLYIDKYAPVEQVGFITNDDHGFTLGYSPDGLVGDDGLIEIKSRRQKHHIATLVNDEVPEEYMLQIQTGLLVSGRTWCDFISYCGGLPMFVKRVTISIAHCEAILKASRAFEERLAEKLAVYRANAARFHPTERKIQQEMYV